MMLKYVVHPGYVDAKQFISGVRLVELFGVRRKEVLFPTKDFPDRSIDGNLRLLYSGISKRQYDNLIPLRPQEDGDYSIERAKTQFVRRLFTGNPI